MLLLTPLKAGNTLICQCLAGTGMNRAGMQGEMENSDLSRSVCFTAELLSGCEKLLISKEGGKAGRENHPLPQHNPSSTSMAPSSFRGLCRHHSQDPENFTRFMYSLSRMKHELARKIQKSFPKATPEPPHPPVKPPAAKNYCCKFHNPQPSFLSQRKIQAKTPPR